MTAFNEIETRLRKMAQADQYTTFYQLVDKLKGQNAAVRYREQDLKEYANLRNAIIHERKGGTVIAEPNEYAVNELETIAAQLTRPPLAHALFAGTVVASDAADPIGPVVKTMSLKKYSQIPIRRGGSFVGLLTMKTVGRWLGDNVAEKLVDLEDTNCADVLGHAETAKTWNFVARTATIFDVIETFQTWSKDGATLDAILITERGTADAAILGIITVADLPMAYGAIALGARTN